MYLFLFKIQGKWWIKYFEAMIITIKIISKIFLMSLVLFAALDKLASFFLLIREG